MCLTDASACVWGEVLGGVWGEGPRMHLSNAENIIVAMHLAMASCGRIGRKQEQFYKSCMILA